jgi:hypothetical protein
MMAAEAMDSTEDTPLPCNLVPMIDGISASDCGALELVDKAFPVRKSTLSSCQNSISRIYFFPSVPDPTAGERVERSLPLDRFKGC